MIQCRDPIAKEIAMLRRTTRYGSTYSLNSFNVERIEGSPKPEEEIPTYLPTAPIYYSCQTMQSKGGMVHSEGSSAVSHV